jgi:hypothetical protein
MVNLSLGLMQLKNWWGGGGVQNGYIALRALQKMAWFFYKLRKNIENDQRQQNQKKSNKNCRI